jgi:hypothetical protein
MEKDSMVKFTNSRASWATCASGQQIILLFSALSNPTKERIPSLFRVPESPSKWKDKFFQVVL